MDAPAGKPPVETELTPINTNVQHQSPAMPEVQGTNEWQYGLFGCFGDCRLCIITFCIPCYTIGKNGEHFGESCMTVGLLYCIGFNTGPVLTWRLRQQRALQGDMVTDTLVGICCSLCQLVREAREIKSDTSNGFSAPSMARS